MSKMREVGYFIGATDHSEIVSPVSIYNLDPKYKDHHRISNWSLDLVLV